MFIRRFAAVFVAAVLVLGGRPVAADDAQKLLRVFLTDGSALVSFGEPARVGDRARKRLADWPLTHFNHRLTEVRQMLTMLDEAIADLRLVATPGRFNLTLTAFVEPPPIPSEPLLPDPTARDLIDQAKKAARI